MRTVDIYIDTSLKGPRRKDGSCLYILSFTTAKGLTADLGQWIRVEDTTENQLTLLGLEAALSHLREPCRLILHLECTYLASALESRWYEKWREAGWMNAKNVPVRDAEIWCTIEYLLNAHEFQVCLKQPHTYREWMHRELTWKAERNRSLRQQAKGTRNQNL